MSYPEVDEYLRKNGYASIEDWGRDSDKQEKNGEWFDENGYLVNLEDYLMELIAEGIAE